MSFVLRPYQEDCLNSLFKYLREHKDKNPLINACVGSGKSLIIAEACKRAQAIRPDTRIVMLTHVKELIEQNYDKLIKQWPDAPAGIYSASVGRKEKGDLITFAGIQSVYKDVSRIGYRHIVIIDEAHLISPDQETMYQTLITELKKMNPRLRVIGFTGTPFRTKDGSMENSGLFHDICYSVGMTELIEQGYLMPLTSKASSVQADLSAVPQRAGEYITSKMSAAMEKDNLTARAIAEVSKWAYNRKTFLYFCSGVDHAYRVRDSLREAGWKCETITGKTKKKERERILEQLRRNEIDAVTNDSVLTTGTDIPNLDCIVLLRGTKSAVLYIQILGRGVRCFGKDAKESHTNGKYNCLVLDFAGNIERFGPVDLLTIGKKNKGDGTGISITPVKICDVCREPSAFFAKLCESCGHPFPINEKPKHETIFSNGAVMSTDIEPKKIRVDDVVYSKHHKRGGIPSLKVMYLTGLRNTATEWVCFNHTGFPRRNAENWWVRRSNLAPPENVDVALKMSAEIRKPSFVYVVPDGKYKKIIGYDFQEEDPS